MVNAANGYPHTDNDIANEALEAAARVDQEAQRKKELYVETLMGARRTIEQRIMELEHQLGQIDQVLQKIKGKAPSGKRPSGAYLRARKDLSDIRDRVGRWMEAHRGQRFFASELAREFPELEGAPISVFMKPLVHTGKVRTDATAGAKRLKYYVA